MLIFANFCPGCIIFSHFYDPVLYLSNLNITPIWPLALVLPSFVVFHLQNKNLTSSVFPPQEHSTFECWDDGTEFNHWLCRVYSSFASAISILRFSWSLGCDSVTPRKCSLNCGRKLNQELSQVGWELRGASNSNKMGNLDGILPTPGNQLWQCNT